MMMARRFDGMGNGYDGTTRRHKGNTDWTGKIYEHDDRLDQPLSWSKPRLVFVDSMSDLFHPGVDFEFIDKVFASMALAGDHIFQILTKRPERIGRRASRAGYQGGGRVNGRAIGARRQRQGAAPRSDPVNKHLTRAPVRLKLCVRVSRGFRLHESVTDRSPYRR